MDTSRNANREDQEVTLQYKTRQEALLEGELIEDKLAQLLEFITQLEQTPPGSAELQRRIKLFGECKRTEDETSVQFYDKLRRWLKRDIPPTNRLYMLRGKLATVQVLEPRCHSCRPATKIQPMLGGESMGMREQILRLSESMRERNEA